MEYAELARFNPWWEERKNIYNDAHITEFQNQKLKFLPGLKAESGVFVLRGPRQVGKTTFLKLKIKELIESGQEPKNILFFSFDLAKDSSRIVETAVHFLEGRAREGKKFLFLDEITQIPDWAGALKMLIDRGDLKRTDLIMVSGSSAIDLKKGAERLPGRGIEGNEYYYLPCSFASCLKLKDIQVEACSLLKPKSFLESAERNIDKLLSLKREFAAYLERGGFLYSLNHGKNELVMEKYARWLEGDFSKAGKNPLVVKEIVAAVIKKSCSQFSYHSIAKETSVSSHNTIIDYMQMLSEELFLETVNKTELPLRVMRKKEKKAFFIDPLLSAIAQRWAEQPLGESCAVEHAVMAHLARMGNLRFYNDGKKEIDCVLKAGRGTLGVEVKWSDNISAQDTYGVKKCSFPYLLSREKFGLVNGVPIIPVCVFLATLDAGDIVKREVLSI